MSFLEKPMDLMEQRHHYEITTLTVTVCPYRTSTIGENMVIGAFSFVSRDIPANAVAVGVPVKITKPIPEGD